ncbi:MAG: SUMF1/EgtB/PvdO family nonheme iron enzyme [Bacteroidota bacterium]
MRRFVCIGFLLLSVAFANNLQISNVSLESQNTTDDYYYVEFDISWENSWRTSTFESNHDAAWVFIKFTPVNQQAWEHATLHYVNGTNDGHTAPAGSVINTSSDGVGIFIYRSADGIGNVNYQNVRLRWDYGTDGLADDAIIEVSVFGVEMVYVPQGAFYAGDGQQDFGQFEAGNTGQPFQITSEAALTLGGTNVNNLNNNNAINMLNPDDFNDGATQSLPAGFPKGFDAFYCMKYEGSQQQYADFLAHLTFDQRNERDGPLYVNAVDVFPIEDGNHYAVADHPWRAMDYLGWPDVAAFLDWSGLRPMSELEFEKACRGPLPPVNNELAWGDDSWYIEGMYTLANEGTAEEMIVSGLGTYVGNANTLSIYSGLDVPLRCGIFAASAENKTRKETGATYWGIMEMTGNAYELMISVGNAQTRDFDGLHGDGNVTSTGNASFSLLSDWAFVNTIGVTIRSSEISTRYLANYNDPDRAKWIGIRGVRTAQ